MGTILAWELLCKSGSGAIFPAMTSLATDPAEVPTVPTLRYRIPELFAEKRVTGYGLVARSEGRLSLATVYRIQRRRGFMKHIEATVAATLCALLGVTIEELLEPVDVPGDAADPVEPETPDAEPDGEDAFGAVPPQGEGPAVPAEVAPVPVLPSRRRARMVEGAPV